MTKTALLFNVFLGFALGQTIPSVLTYHNDNARTGQNNQETILTQSNVNTKTFGKLFTYPVDGQVYAQPLFAPHQTIHGTVHNVVFIATANDSVYAFDADSNTGANANPLWHTSFINPPSVVPVPPGDVDEDYDDITPVIGIIGTPVLSEGKIFVVAKTKETDGQGNVTYVQRLHALVATTGKDMVGSPVVINPTFPGNCTPNNGAGEVTFGALFQNQRPALLAYRGTVYVAWASHGDFPPYQGWIVGYDETNLAQVAALNVDPNQSGTCKGGIWMSGSGVAADTLGNLYVATGNGYFKPPASGGQSYGDSWLRMTTSLVPVDYFTPDDQQTMNLHDRDLGSGGLVILPTQTGPYPDLMTGAGKEGTIYLVNRNNMGMYDASGDVQIVQEIPNANAGMWGAPVYFRNTVYFAGAGDYIRAFQLVNGKFNTPPALTTNKFAYPGPGLSITSSPGGLGILWALDSKWGEVNSYPSVLHAFKADNIGVSLYCSCSNPPRDAPGDGVKFSIPTVVNGKVYIGGASSVSVYGLLPPK